MKFQSQSKALPRFVNSSCDTYTAMIFQVDIPAASNHLEVSCKEKQQSLYSANVIEAHNLSSKASSCWRNQNI